MLEESRRAMVVSWRKRRNEFKAIECGAPGQDVELVLKGKEAYVSNDSKIALKSENFGRLITRLD